MTLRAHHPPRLRKLRWLLALVIAGCSVVPPEPTVIPERTPETETPPPPTFTPAPTLTAPPTWTAIPTETLPPTVTIPPTNTAPPPTATADLRSSPAPTLIDGGGGGLEVMITEILLNAALARNFDALPLPNYAVAPRATLTDSAILLALHIVPRDAPAGSAPQPLTLYVGLATPGGVLETAPTRLEPLDTAVSTQQVKLGEALLMRTLDELAVQAAGSARIFYNGAEVGQGVITLKVVRAG